MARTRKKKKKKKKKSKNIPSHRSKDNRSQYPILGVTTKSSSSQVGKNLFRQFRESFKDDPSELIENGLPVRLSSDGRSINQPTATRPRCRFDGGDTSGYVMNVLAENEVPLLGALVSSVDRHRLDARCT